MGQISITIQKRTYRLSCDDGQESRLTELADHVRQKADQLIEEYGRISDEHLMLMSAILVADELWDERAGKTPGQNSARRVSAQPDDNPSPYPSRRKPREKAKALAD